MLELSHCCPVLDIEVGDAAHVGAHDQEVRREGHAADHVVFSGLRENFRLLVFSYDALGLEHVQLDFPVISKVNKRLIL